MLRDWVLVPAGQEDMRCMAGAWWRHAQMGVQRAFKAIEGLTGFPQT